MALQAEQVTIIRAGLNADAYKVGADVVASANARMAGSGDAVVEATLRTTRALADSGGAAERYRRQVDTGYSAVQQYARVQDAMTRAVRDSRMEQETANGVLDAWRQRLSIVTNEQQEATRRTNEYTAALRQQAAAQTAVNQFASSQGGNSTGAPGRDWTSITAALQTYETKLSEVNALEAGGALSSQQANRERALALSSYSRVLADQSAAERSASAKRGEDIAFFGNALEAARAKYDPLFAASRRYEAQLEEIALLEKQGVFGVGSTGTAQADAARDRLTKAYSEQMGTARALGLETNRLNENIGKTGPTAGQSAMALQQLGIQSIDVFQGLASGAPVMTTLIQQGGQLGQVMAMSGVGMGIFGKAASMAWAAVISPLGLGIAATAALAGFAIAAESSAVRMGNLGNQIGASRDNFQGMARDADDAARMLAKVSALSTSEARSMVNPIFTSGAFSGTAAQAADIARTFEKLNIALGVSISDTGRLEQAMKDPLALAQRLLGDNPNLRGLDAGLLRAIENFQNAGQSAKAFDLLMGGLKETTAKTTEQVTPLRQAIHNLEEALYGAQTGGKGLIETLGTPLTNVLAAALAGVNFFARAIIDLPANFETVRKEIAKGFPSFPGFTGSSGSSPGSSVVPNPGGSGYATGLPITGALPGATVAIPAGAAGDALKSEATVARAIEVVSGLMARGVDRMTATAFSANFAQESSANFQSIAGDGGKSHGLAQWNGPRLARFQQLNNGLLPEQTSLGANLDFLMLELKTSEAGAMQAIGQYTTLVGKAAAVSTFFERPGKTMEIKGVEEYRRAALAQQLDQRLPGASGAAAAAPGAAPAPISVTIAQPPSVRLPGSGTGATAPGGAEGGAYGVGDTVQKAIADAEAYRKSLGLVEDRMIALTAARNKLQTAADLAGTKGDTAEQERLAKAVQAVNGEIERNRTPQQEYLRAQREAATIAQASTEGDRSLLEVKVRLAQINREHPESVTAGAVAEAEANLIREKTGVLGQLITAQGFETEQQTKLAAAYGKGYPAVALATAGTRAFTEAVKLFPQGSDGMKSAIDALTTAYLRNDAARAVAASRQASLGIKDEMVMIEAERGALMMGTEARQLYLSQLKLEIDLRRSSNGTIPQEEVDRRLKENEAYVKAGQTLAAQKGAMNDLASSFSQSFDTIGNAITQSLVAGQGAAVNWRNVMMSAAQQVIQAFLKMALINPILNEILPGSTHRSTISDLIGGAGGSSGGGMFGGGSSGGGSNGSGLIGGIGSLFGAGKFLSGEGGGLFSSISNAYTGSWLQGLFGGGTTATQAAAGAAEGYAYGAATLAGEIGANGNTGIMGLLGIAHSGWNVGAEAAPEFRYMDASVLANANRYHNGLGADEFGAILQRGERVMTAEQNASLTKILGGGGGAPNDNRPSGQAVTINNHFNFPGGDADSFRKSQTQVANSVGGSMSRAMQRTRSR